MQKRQEDSLEIIPNHQNGSYK